MLHLKLSQPTSSSSIKYVQYWIYHDSAVCTLPSNDDVIPMQKWVTTNRGRTLDSRNCFFCIWLTIIEREGRLNVNTYRRPHDFFAKPSIFISSLRRLSSSESIAFYWNYGSWMILWPVQICLFRAGIRVMKPSACRAMTARRAGNQLCNELFCNSSLSLPFREIHLIPL